LLILVSHMSCQCISLWFWFQFCVLVSGVEFPRMEAPDINLCEYDSDELEDEYEDKCNEVVELQNELRASKLEAQQLRMRLKGVLPPTGSLVALPDSGGMTEERRKRVEMQSFFEWLAVSMDLCYTEELDVGFHLPLQGRQFVLGSVTQWHSKDGRLRLSVPTEFSKEVSSVFMMAQALGGKIEENVARHLADSWELVQTFILVAGQPEPAVLLAHRQPKQGVEQSMLLASWPTPEDVASLITQADGNIAVNELSTGMRVEVEYAGQWYCGALHAVDVAAGRASVICDVDAPGVVTHAPVASLRSPGGIMTQNPKAAHPSGNVCQSSQQSRPQHRHNQFGRHRRSKSAM